MAQLRAVSIIEFNFISLSVQLIEQSAPQKLSAARPTIRTLSQFDEIRKVWSWSFTVRGGKSMSYQYISLLELWKYSFRILVMHRNQPWRVSSENYCLLNWWKVRSHYCVLLNMLHINLTSLAITHLLLDVNVHRI